jgi:predicted metal-dependent HD superfamily phosphohydrolase
MTLEIKLGPQIEAAKPFYNPDLPYHNWNHAEAVLENSKWICRELGKRSIKVNEPIVYVADIWHDAGYSDPEANNFETKEHYSAFLAGQYLEQQDFPDWFKEGISDSILGTRHGVPRPKIEALVVHRSDILNLGGLGSIFLQNAEKIWREEMMLTGESIPWEEFRQRTMKFMDFTVEEARQEILRLQGKFYAGMSMNGSLSLGGPMSFDTRVVENRRALEKRSEPREQAV